MRAWLGEIRGITRAALIALLLENLLSRPQPLLVQNLLAWHHALPPADPGESPVSVELVAALMVRHVEL